MGGPKPWPTRWPEPIKLPFENDEFEEPLADPDYDIEEDPQEAPYRLPEERIKPTSVTWGVTHRCNLHCDFCYDSVGCSRIDLDTYAALEVVKRLKHAGIDLIVFSGGEPMLRRDIFDLMTHCRAHDLDIGMRSNGTLITDKVAHRLQELDLAVAGISLDGASEASHDTVRGPGAFQKTISAIQRLVTVGIRVNIEVVLTRRNAHQSLVFVELAGRLGVDEINFSALVSEGRAKILDGVILDPALWRELTIQLYKASLNADVVISPSCALVGPCWACIEPNITCDGWVTPCYLSKRKLFHIFDVTPDVFQARLREYQTTMINICGREYRTEEQNYSIRLDSAPKFDLLPCDKLTL